MTSLNDSINMIGRRAACRFLILILAAGALLLAGPAGRAATTQPGLKDSDGDGFIDGPDKTVVDEQTQTQYIYYGEDKNGNGKWDRAGADGTLGTADDETDPNDPTSHPSGPSHEEAPLSDVWIPEAGYDYFTTFMDYDQVVNPANTNRSIGWGCGRFAIKTPPSGVNPTSANFKLKYELEYEKLQGNDKSENPVVRICWGIGKGDPIDNQKTYSLPPGSEKKGVWDFSTMADRDDIRSSLMVGRAFVEVVTAKYSTGELRGDIVLCLNDKKTRSYYVNSETGVNPGDDKYDIKYNLSSAGCLDYECYAGNGSCRYPWRTIQYAFKIALLDPYVFLNRKVKIYLSEGEYSENLHINTCPYDIELIGGCNSTWEYNPKLYKTSLSSPDEMPVLYINGNGINALNSNISLRGLIFDGARAEVNSSAIILGPHNSIYIRNCVLRNYKLFAIDINNSRIKMVNSVIVNSGTGIRVSGSDACIYNNNICDNKLSIGVINNNGKRVYMKNNIVYNSVDLCSDNKLIKMNNYGDYLSLIHSNNVIFNHKEECIVIDNIAYNELPGDNTTIPIDIYSDPLISSRDDYSGIPKNQICINGGVPWENWSQTDAENILQYWPRSSERGDLNDFWNRNSDELYAIFPQKIDCIPDEAIWKTMGCNFFTRSGQSSLSSDIGISGGLWSIREQTQSIMVDSVIPHLNSIDVTLIPGNTPGYIVVRTKRDDSPPQWPFIHFGYNLSDMNNRGGQIIMRNDQNITKFKDVVTEQGMYRYYVYPVNQIQCLGKTVSFYMAPTIIEACIGEGLCVYVHDTYNYLIASYPNTYGAQIDKMRVLPIISDGAKTVTSLVSSDDLGDTTDLDEDGKAKTYNKVSSNDGNTYSAEIVASESSGDNIQNNDPNGSECNEACVINYLYAKNIDPFFGFSNSGDHMDLGAENFYNLLVSKNKFKRRGMLVSQDDFRAEREIPDDIDVKPTGTPKTPKYQDILWQANFDYCDMAKKGGIEVKEKRKLVGPKFLKVRYNQQNQADVLFIGGHGKGRGINLYPGKLRPADVKNCWVGEKKDLDLVIFNSCQSLGVPLSYFKPQIYLNDKKIEYWYFRREYDAEDKDRKHRNWPSTYPDIDNQPGIDWDMSLNWHDELIDNVMTKKFTPENCKVTMCGFYWTSLVMMKGMSEMLWQNWQKSGMKSNYSDVERNFPKLWLKMYQQLGITSLGTPLSDKLKMYVRNLVLPACTISKDGYSFITYIPASSSQTIGTVEIIENKDFRSSIQ